MNVGELYFIRDSANEIRKLEQKAYRKKAAKEAFWTWFNVFAWFAVLVFAGFMTVYKPLA